MIALRKWIVLGISLSVVACSGSEDGGHQQLPSRGEVTVNGIEFEYFIEGSGIPCMVIGDALTPSRALSASLRETFQFIFLNSRMTTPEEIVGDVSTVTMDTLTSDIEGARQALGLGQVCVMGHSISGVLALEYGRKYPESTRCVVMHASPPYENQRFLDFRAAYWEEHASDERKQAMAASWAAIGEDSVSKLSRSEAGILDYVTNAPRYFYDPSYDPKWLFEGAYWNIDAWGKLIAAADYDPGEGTPVSVPVFLALGREDYGVPYPLWDSERGKIPNLTYQLFDSSAHYPMMEDQELFDQALVSWIQSIEQ